MRSNAGRLTFVTGLIAGVLAVIPSPAAAAVCPLPGADDPDFATAIDVTGTVAESRQGGYVQIPFDVPAGTSAIRVRYSYDQPGDLCSPPASSSNTLDIGVYEPRDPGETVFGMDESRGWSGSAVRDLAIARNGFSDETTYEAAPKALVTGRTTRAYRPGEIPAGTWAVELGLALIEPDTDGEAEYRVLVETTADGDWEDDPYVPAGYSSAAVRPTPGWYAGDLHLHGEQEPGNATMTDTFAEAFGPLPDGGGLDFVTIVDHNNNVAHDNLAGHQAANPENLIIPGVEETTYRGHHNNQGRGPLTDFRGGPVLAPQLPLGPAIPDADLEQVQGASPPSAAFAEEVAEGNWSQINHPEIFRSAPSLCRGCAWSYDDAETDRSEVDAIEVQTGPAGVPSAAPTVMNPFTAEAIAFYERALDTGAHIAAVGSSDDHQAGTDTGPFASPAGRGATMVFAEELSEQGITEGVKGDHTYVKTFGNDGPDVTLTAAAPGGSTGIIGDTVAGPSAELTATVTGAASSGRPGSWSLILLKDGAPLETVPFSGDSFTQTFTDAGSGRYSLQVVRTQLAANYTEVYTSPIWFEAGGAVANQLRIVRVKLNKRKGTAKLIARVSGAGDLTASGKGLKKDRAEAEGAGRVKLAIKPKSAKLKRRLERDGRARVKAKVRFAPAAGEPLAKTRKIKLKLRPKR